MSQLATAAGTTSVVEETSTDEEATTVGPDRRATDGRDLSVTDGPEGPEVAGSGTASGEVSTWRDPRLRAALALAVVVHGALLASGSFRGTYDAWVHIFFGDHYARDWFSTWEPRWYTGFTIVSYPPASHQSIGLVSKLVGLEWAFAFVQLVAVLNVTAGVYRFSLLWVSRRAAGWAAILAVVSSSLAEVVHTFGQLPTTFALGFLLHAQPSVRRWVYGGVRVDFVAGLALLAATTAGHHVTTLFGSVFFTGPTAVRALLDRWGTPVDDEPTGHVTSVRPSLLLPQVSRRLRRTLPALVRLAVLGASMIGVLVTVVLPYWLWSHSDPILQVPIPHASRNDFLDDTAAGLVFWFVPWIGIALIAPFAFLRAVCGRSWPLAASIGLLTLLGTGGTTPIPRALLGGAFDILTLDRFTIWATVAILPFAGWAVESLRVGVLADVVRARLGTMALRVGRTAVVAVAIFGCVFAATLTTHRPFQPEPIDPTPIVSFMEKDQHDRWRYLTLGFGDQMAWVGANTTALTVDGNYHSARRLPELTSRSVERLEGAKYRGVPGLGSLQQFLVNPSPYHLKFVFSVDRFYDPLLWASGWQRIGRLDNDVEVWERADVPPLPDVLPVREIPDWQRAMWGVLPLTSVTAGALTLIWLAAGRPLPRRVVRWREPRPGAGRLLRRIDRRLARSSDRLRGRDELRPQRSAWTSLGRRVDRVVEIARTPSSPRTARATSAALAAGVVAIVLALGSGATASPTPEQRIVAFYEALDFQRFETAHSLLDPSTRPELADYLLAISVRDGLVAGYAELDAVESTVVVDGDRAEADVELTFVTSVAEYRIDRRHRLVRLDDEWYLEPDDEVTAIGTDELVVRPEITVSAPTGTVVDVGAGDFQALLDRPRLSMGPSTTYRAGERWIVVGTLTNGDVDPADVTVNASLVGDDDVLLASYDAGQSTIHQVLPGETVPYRIDVEGRAGSVDRDDPVAGAFDPLAYSAPVIDEEVVRVEVAARAVVTGGQLDRVVDEVSATATATVTDAVPEEVPEGLEPLADDADDGADDAVGTTDGVAVAVELRNAGAIPATVTRLSLSFLDAEGRVVWVDHQWVPDAVRPRQKVATAWTTALPDIVSADVETATFADDPGDASRDDSALLVPVTPGADGMTPAVDGRTITHVRIDVSSFQRQVRP